MDKGKKYCRFVALSKKLGVHDSFFIEDGGTIFINDIEKNVTYIDEYHFMINFKCYHINEFFEKVVVYGDNLVLPGKGLKTMEYGSNYAPCKSLTYEKVSFPDLGDKQFLYTDMRIIRETIPLGYYGYDIRHDDECQGIACEIAEYVRVNHLGTIITMEPLLYPNEKLYLKRDMRFEEKKKEIAAI